MKRFFINLSLLCGLLLSACGFSLSYNQSIPVKTLYIADSNASPHLINDLAKALQAKGVNIVTNPKTASATLQIVGESFQENVMSYGNVGQTTSYTMIYTLTYQVLDRSGKMLIKPSTITSTRNFSLTSSQINSDLIAKKNLEKELQNNMITQLVNQFVHQQ